jgi:hypothetical protein
LDIVGKACPLFATLFLLRKNGALFCRRQKMRGKKGRLFPEEKVRAEKVGGQAFSATLQSWLHFKMHIIAKSMHPKCIYLNRLTTPPLPWKQNNSNA